MQTKIYCARVEEFLLNIFLMQGAIGSKYLMWSERQLDDECMHGAHRMFIAYKEEEQKKEIKINFFQFPHHCFSSSFLDQPQCASLFRPPAETRTAAERLSAATLKRSEHRWKAHRIGRI